MVNLTCVWMFMDGLSCGSVKNFAKTINDGVKKSHFSVIFVFSRYKKSGYESRLG